MKSRENNGVRSSLLSRWVIWHLCLFLLAWPLYFWLPPIEEPSTYRDPRIILHMLIFASPMVLPPMVLIRDLFMDRSGGDISRTIVTGPFMSYILISAGSLSMYFHSLNTGLWAILMGLLASSVLLLLTYVRPFWVERERHWMILSTLAGVWAGVSLFVGDMWVRTHVEGILGDLFRGLLAGIPYTAITVIGLPWVMRSRGHIHRLPDTTTEDVARLLRINKRLLQEDERHYRSKRDRQS